MPPEVALASRKRQRVANTGYFAFDVDERTTTTSARGAAAAQRHAHAVDVQLDILNTPERYKAGVDIRTWKHHDIVVKRAVAEGAWEWVPVVGTVHILHSFVIKKNA